MFNLPGNILILTGSPGAGKSTTAQSLAAESHGPAVHLHSDDFWGFIKKGLIPPWFPEAHKQNEVVMAVVAEAANGYANGDYFVVVDGIVGPWFLHLFEKLKRPLHYIVLRPTLDAAIEHCRARGGNTLTDPGTIAALHKQFSALGPLEGHAIEIHGHSPDDTLAAVQAALVSGRFRLGRDKVQSKKSNSR